MISISAARLAVEPIATPSASYGRCSTEVRGRPLGALHLITFNADEQAQHIAANYRPLSSVMFFSRLLRERFAGTPYAAHFLTNEPEQE